MTTPASAAKDPARLTPEAGSIAQATTQTQPPRLLHSLKLERSRSVLALAISPLHIFAGTDDGQILVFSFDTFQKVYQVNAHRGSILALDLAQRNDHIISCGSDGFIHIWQSKSMNQLYSIYPHPHHDIGDIYSVAYAASINTIFIGTQNASILWYDLDNKDLESLSDQASHPYTRRDRFFDSAGPGGVCNPRPEYFDEYSSTATDTHDLQIDQADILSFAHFGYVYCMLLVPGIPNDDSEKEFLVTGGGDGTIKVWTLCKAGHQKISLSFQLGESHGDSVLSFTLDGSFLISGTAEGRLKVWDLETRQMVRDLRTNVGQVLTLTVGNGCLFASGTKGEVEKFDHQYERVLSYGAHPCGYILASKFASSRNPPVYITGANDRTIKVWDAQDCLKDQVAIANPISNVSSSEHCRTDCRRGASFLRSLFRQMGATSDLWPLEDPNLNPIVYAEFKASPNLLSRPRRVLFYAHYDVVSAGNDHKGWIVNPFQMQGINEYLYGRGTSDNKGPLLAAIFAVADLLKEKTLNVDVVFLVEGEEECGSRGLEEAIRKWRPKIGHVDWILLANSYWMDDELPCLTYGLRGVIRTTIEISSKDPDLHSGKDGTSRGHESMKDLISLLHTIMDFQGEVKIPGFYQPIPALTSEEMDHYNKASAALLSRNPNHGTQEQIKSDLQQRWREASLTIHNIETTAPAHAAIIPHLVKANISLRLVPHQDASKIADDLVRFLQEQFNNLGSTNTMRVTIDHKADPWLGDYNNIVYKILEEAVIKTWPEKFSGQQTSKATQTETKSEANHVLLEKPLYIREGGSIPAIRVLERILDAPAAHLPCGQSSDNAHLDNERFRLANLFGSRSVFKQLFRELPRMTAN